MQRQEIIEKDIPYIPSLVDMADVDQATGRLMSREKAAEIIKVIAAQHENQDGRYSKKMLGTDFSVAKAGSRYFAIYKGEKCQKLLGKGAFGAVKLVQDIEDGSWAVMKTIARHKDKSIEHLRSSVEKEVKCLEAAAQLLGSYERDSKSKGLQAVIFMPLAQGVSVKEMIAHRSMPAVKWLDLSISMVDAVLDVQALGMVHRDIKPANMMCDPVTGVVKMIDFGLARRVNPDSKAFLGYYAGSDRYLAPEIMKRDKKKRSFNESTEVYALGVSLLECFNLTAANGRVERTFEFAKKIPNPYLQANICDLIERMLQRNSENRPFLKDIYLMFDRMRACELDMVSKVNSLVYLSVEEYFFAKTAQRQNVIASLKSADEVQLCSHPEFYNPVLCMQLRHELENAGVCVLDRAVILDDSDMQQAAESLREHTNSRADTNGVLYSGYYLNHFRATDFSAEHCYSRSIDRFQVSALHRSVMIGNIAEQINRLTAKNPNDSRLTALQEFSNALSDDEIKTYSQLFGKLNELHAAMHRQDSKAKTILNKLGFLSTMDKKLDAANRELTDDLRGLARGNLF